MWLFGHLGIGSRLVRPISRGLPVRWILAGTVLPDFIDKPLFLISNLVTGGPRESLISCTRTFGHSGIFLLAILLHALIRRSRIAAALAAGLASHLLLDGLQDAVNHRFFGASGESSMLLAILYPFHRPYFAPYPFQDLHEHAGTFFHPLVVIAEMLGVFIVYRDFIRPRLIKKRTKSAS